MAKPIRNQNPKKQNTRQKPKQFFSQLWAWIELKQFFLYLSAVAGIFLTADKVIQGIISYAEWEPRLIIDFKPSPPNILDTEFSLKNDGKFTLKNVHAKAQLFGFEYANGTVLRAAEFGTVSFQSLFSPVGDILPGNTKFTRPLAETLSGFSYDVIPPDQWKVVTTCLQVSFQVFPFRSKEETVGFLVDKRLGINEWMPTSCDTAIALADRARKQREVEDVKRKRP